MIPISMTPGEASSYALFLLYLVGFFGFSARAAREAKRSVWLFNSGPAGQSIPATLFRVAFVGAAIWPIVGALRGVSIASDPIRGILDFVALDWVGFLLVASGLVLALVAQMHMGTSWRVGAAEREVGTLVDDGPFAFSRNPVFVGQALLFVGLFLVFPGIVQGLLTAALLIAVVKQVPIEESVLAATLGEPYKHYCSRVARWFGLPRS